MPLRPGCDCLWEPRELRQSRGKPAARGCVEKAAKGLADDRAWSADAVVNMVSGCFRLALLPAVAVSLVRDGLTQDNFERNVFGPKVPRPAFIK